MRSRENPSLAGGCEAPRNFGPAPYGGCPDSTQCPASFGRSSRAHLHLLLEPGDAQGEVPARQLLDPGHHLVFELLLEVRGSLKLFGGIYRLKRDLIRSFAELGHQAVVGIAPTPLAATAFARAGHAGELPSRPSDSAWKAYAARGLARLRLEHTELEPWLIERLENMGIETLGQLLRLPKAELGRRFGPALLDYLARLRGTRPDPRRNITPASGFVERLDLLEAVTDKESLLFPMQRLLGELDNWLVARQLGTQRLHWRFAPLQGGAVEFEVEFSTLQHHRPALLSISRFKLEQTALPEEILSIELAASQLMSWQPVIDTLFTSGRRPRQAPDELIDRFRARLGDDAFQGIRLHDDHRPELAWRDMRPRMPATGRSGIRGGMGVQDMPSGIARRPAWLLESPVRVDRRALHLLSGPERIETGWWDVQDVQRNDQWNDQWGDQWKDQRKDQQDEEASESAAHNSTPCKVVRRDYYLARDHNGTHCWVFKTLDDGCWFIHGYFA
jgi:protein ImuB